MTVVAFRDDVLASDSLSTSVHGWRTGALQKIYDLGSGVFAATVGYAPHALELLAWFRAGRTVTQPAALDDDRTGTLVVFEPHGEIVIYENGCQQPEGVALFHAYGAGAEIAIGAMHMGATAEEAVLAGIEHHTQCGGPVQVLRR